MQFCILHFFFVLFCDVLCQLFVLDYRAAFYIFVKHNNDVAAHNKFREHKVKVVVISGVGYAIVPCIIYAVKDDVCVFDFIIGIFGVVVKFFEFFVFTSVVFFKKRWLDCFLYSKCTQAGTTIDVEKKVFFPSKGVFG